jgi:hypothetical protein
MAKEEELVSRRFKQCGAFFFFFFVVVVVLLCLHFILFMANGPICKINDTVVVEQSFSNVKQISRTLGIDIVVVEAHPFA